MVAHLMGQHVCHGKLAGSSEAVMQFFAKAQIDVHLLIGRAIKRAIGRSPHTTAIRWCPITVNYQRIGPERRSLLMEDRLPNVFRTGLDHLYKIRKLLFLGTDLHRPFRRLGTGLELFEYLLRITPEK